MYEFDADSLIKSRRRVKLPFRLSIRVDDIGTFDITVREILRLLPGKRLALLADDGHRKLFVKLFIGRAARRYRRRELLGVSAMDTAKVPTPTLLWQGRLCGRGRGLALAFEYVNHASNLTEAFKGANDQAGRLAVMTRVMPILAKLHQGGVVQNDIHPGNFLITDESVYLIDGGDVVKKAQAALSEADSLNNLAQFCAQFQPRFNKLIPQVLENYRLHRGWQENDIQEALLSSKIHACQETRKADYIQKAFRDCTRISCRSSFRRFQVCERKYDTPAMRMLLSNLDAAIDKARDADCLLKDGNTSTLARIECPEGPLVVKRYNLKNFTHRLERAFRKSRAWISWGNIFRLEFLGINTAEPIALVEERFGPIRLRAYLVTKYIAGSDASSLNELADPTPAISSIARLLCDMTEVCLTHGDLKASNFLLSSDGPMLIDLDSMREHQRGKPFTSAVQKDLARFMKNWESNPRISTRFATLLKDCIIDTPGK